MQINCGFIRNCVFFISFINHMFYTHSNSIVRSDELGLQEENLKITPSVIHYEHTPSSVSFMPRPISNRPRPTPDQDNERNFNISNRPIEFGVRPALKRALNSSNPRNYDSIKKFEHYKGRHQDYTVEYPLNSTFYKVISIQAHSYLRINITSISKEYVDFLVVQAHSQFFNIILSSEKIPREQNFVNSTDVGLVAFLDKSKNQSLSATVYMHNYHENELRVLLIVRNYTNKEPIPGGLYNSSSSQAIPHPYMFLNQSLLTTWVSFPLASLYNITISKLRNVSFDSSTHLIEPKPTPLTPAKMVKYEVYLTYMYEGDLLEDQYYHSIIKTSNVKGLKLNAKKVCEIDHVANTSSTWIHELFVSYSGVGAVVSVVASFNGSQGVLYASAAFYGCDFPDEAIFQCTKLVSSFAKLCCGLLPFVGVGLLLWGHRALNYTMFMAGFFATWLVLFVIFIHVPYADVDVTGICTFFAAILGGVCWLVAWHKFQRPFYSALLIILLNSLFIAMISTHFLKYALVPTRHNIAAFVVFPIAFSLAVIAYSVFDIKKVHIFSCCLLGSYAVVSPFSFYFGSSLTYIVINIVSEMSVPGFSKAVGYPPFQDCDIALLCVWTLLFLIGLAFQTYRERSAPPFYPPNTSSLRVAFSLLRLLQEKISHVCPCCKNSSDDDSLFEDRPSIASRVTTFFRGTSDEGHRSNYQSFPRIGSEDEESSITETLLGPFRRLFELLRQEILRLRQRFGGSDPLREDLPEEGPDDVEPLQSGNETNHRETEFEEPVRTP